MSDTNIRGGGSSRNEQVAARDRAERALAGYAATLAWNTEPAFEASRLQLLSLVREVIEKVSRV